MKVLIKKSVEREKGFTIGVLMNKPPVAGDVGIEVEVEGKNLPHEHFGYWSYHADGSLRGEENGEYVLTKPIKFEEVPTAIDNLFGKFAMKQSVLDDSNRTSVHVHLNVTNFHFNRLTAFLAMYFCFEEILTNWAGDHRVGNLFCLRAKDAPAIISQLRRFLKTDGRSELRDNHHYAGCNTHALSKFGSIEIRTLRGITDKQTVLDWVAILERLYKLSADFKDPRELCSGFSGEGPSAFFDSILGETAVIVRQGCAMNEDAIRDSLYEGIRLAQDLCYCRDWGNFDGIDLKADPFGRDARKLAKRMGTPIPSLSQYVIDHEAYAPAPSAPHFVPPIGNGYNPWQSAQVQTGHINPPVSTLGTVAQAHMTAAQQMAHAQAILAGNNPTYTQAEFNAEFGPELDGEDNF